MRRLRSKLLSNHAANVPCGRSGLKLPAISLGAWETFGGYRDAEVARDCILRAFDLGITHFDLAQNELHGFDCRKDGQGGHS